MKYFRLLRHKLSTSSSPSGIFAPISKISKLGTPLRTRTPPAPRRLSSKDAMPLSVDVSHVTARVDTGQCLAEGKIFSFII